MHDPIMIDLISLKSGFRSLFAAQRNLLPCSRFLRPIYVNPDVYQQRHAPAYWGDMLIHCFKNRGKFSSWCVDYFNFFFDYTKGKRHLSAAVVPIRNVCVCVCDIDQLKLWALCYCRNGSD